MPLKVMFLKKEQVEWWLLVNNNSVGTQTLFWGVKFLIFKMLNNLITIMINLGLQK